MRLKTIKKNIAASLVIACSLFTPMYAADAKEALPELDLKYAIEMGIGMDDMIPQYARNITVYEANKEDTRNTGSQMYQNYQISANEAETKIAYRKDIITKSVLNSYYGIINTQEAIKLNESSIALQEKLLKQNKIRLDKGMYSQFNYDKDTQALADLKEQGKQYEKDLANLKSQFLKMTNINVDKYTMTPNYTYNEFDLEKPINAYASSAAGELVKYQKQLAEVSESFFWDTIYQSGPGGGGPTYSTYITKKVEVQNKLDNVETAYKNYKQVIESKYIQVEKELSDLTTKLAAYEYAEKALKPLEIKYKAGYVSAMELERQQLDVESKKFEYLRAVETYNVHKFQIEHPWSIDELAF